MLVIMQQLRTGRRWQRRAWATAVEHFAAYGGYSNCFPPSRAGTTVSTHVPPLCCRSVETLERRRGVGVREANTLARLHSDARWFVFLILPSKIFHDNFTKTKTTGSLTPQGTHLFAVLHTSRFFSAFPRQHAQLSQQGRCPAHPLPRLGPVCLSTTVREGEKRQTG